MKVRLASTLLFLLLSFGAFSQQVIGESHPHSRSARWLEQGYRWIWRIRQMNICWQGGSGEAACNASRFKINSPAEGSAGGSAIGPLAVQAAQAIK